MTTRYRLTVEGLVKLARLERPDIADWIEAKVQENAAAIAADLAQPIDTAAGPLVPGRRYNVTVSVERHGHQPGRRVMRNVTPKRGGSFGDRLVHESGKTAAYLYTSGSGQVMEIEEL